MRKTQEKGNDGNTQTKGWKDKTDCKTDKINNNIKIANTIINNYKTHQNRANLRK